MHTTRWSYTPPRRSWRPAASGSAAQAPRREVELAAAGEAFSSEARPSRGIEPGVRALVGGEKNLFTFTYFVFEAMKEKNATVRHNQPNWTM